MKTDRMIKIRLYDYQKTPINRKEIKYKVRAYNKPLNTRINYSVPMLKCQTIFAINTSWYKQLNSSKN